MPDKEGEKRMSKIQTPAMDRIERAAGRKKKTAAHSHEVWKRLKRNKLAVIGLIIFAVYIIMAIAPGIFTPYRYDTQDYSQRFLQLSLHHPFGTDNFGRDIYTRVIYASRVSLGISLVSVLFSLVVGGIMGAVAAFYGKRADNIIMRVIDVLQSIPSILLAISIAAALGKGVVNLMLAMGISTIPPYARVVRASVLTVKDKQYVEAGRCIGASDRWLILRHMIPNAMGPIIVQATFGVAISILVISSLSYIGLGIQPPTPEWGSMLSDGKQFLQQANAWALTAIPGIAIILVSFALNVLGDGLRDAFDPKLR
jgi:peptide/nickel transport system permease protein